ncbi:class I SAM-dependent RNA methyltransferase [bacterium]|nr:class I SAM-dependent RNA methyltransferase [bacterium]MBU1063654.1 class I SAM-dependent RNA methyltransferase [bacterium]MBU1633584.1 class I SAM-dependent RNA methyltransferase [bacterium]MBU1872377.1 class I SAM-dependent RNA methyltransferase [bacterium]
MKDFEYSLSRRFFAQIANGMEDFGKSELAELGAEDIKNVYRGLYFNADNEAVYRINYQSRLITRVVAPLLTFDCHSADYLYKTAMQIPWDTLFNIKNTFAVFASVSHSKITHSKYAALRLKDAIVDYFKEQTGDRPNIEKLNPDIWLNLHIEQNRAVISVDTSGGSLHRRGYRSQAGSAPMQETLAAAIIRLTDWHGEKPLIDPMCGSGTLLLEALMAYCKIPAGYFRKRFGFEFLPDYNKQLWNKVRNSADKTIRQLPKGLLSGSDVSRYAIEDIIKNSKNFTSGRNIQIRAGDYRDIEAINDSIIVSNPPYGIRMGKEKDMGLFYRELGDFLKQRCRNSTAYIYFGDREYIKNVGLKPSFKIPLVNGALDGRLVKYELY